MSTHLKVQKVIKKHAVVAALLIATFVLSFYTLLTTPFVFFADFGIPLMTLNAKILWTLFDEIFQLCFDVEISGEDEFEKIKQKESVIVISNHLGAIDFCIINALSKRKNMLPRAKYMIKDSMKYVPIFGYIQFLGFIMMKRNYDKDKNTILSWITYYKKKETPIWLVIYPEGTRYTAKKLQQSIEFCKSRNLNPNKHVLYPRPRGFKTTIEMFRDSYVQKVIDLTVVYTSFDSKNNEMPSLWKFLFGQPRGKFNIDIKVHEISSIADCRSFLVEKFADKDHFIEKIRTNGFKDD